ncbi:MAG: hypothetical protein GY737_30695 [Desulfobacteraceae bacterium]|nr:hypothetical protein [Desulfobacteraceae bacterium]
MTFLMEHSSIYRTILLLLISSVISGCAGVTGNLADGLSAAIRENSDLATVKEGGPAYLIMVDAFVMDDPTNPRLLKSAAGLYATYSRFFVADKERRRILTGKALDYAGRAACEANGDFCGLVRVDPDTFNEKIASATISDTAVLYTLGTAWVGWIQARSDSIKALARLPRIEAIMARVVELDEGYMDGSAHIYLGALAMVLPPVLGGKPGDARAHFERGVELGGDRNLMARVLYAKKYARPMFDRELHDRLLTEVMSMPAATEGYTLINTLAKEQARALLESGDDYF